jgi:hypothetical protein
MANAIIQKAFNAGYLIEKYLPQLSKMLVKGFQNSKQPFAQGFIAGSNEYAQEKEHGKSRFAERLRENFDKNRARYRGRDRKDKEMDIDI